MPGTTIVGSGRYLPGEPVSNAALARVMETSDSWIKQRTGIEQRHFAPEGVGASDLAVEASKQALEAAGLAAGSVDVIVFATMTPDYIFPGSGGLLGAKLGLHGVPALDIRQQCAAVPFGLQVSDGLIASGGAATVLFVAAEAHAGFMPWTDWDVLEGKTDSKVAEEDWQRATRHRGTAILFGDGAGAWVLQRSETPQGGLLGSRLHSDGDLAKQIYIEGGGFRQRPYLTAATLEREQHIPQMTGRELFKHAVVKLPEVIRALCAEHGVSLQDIDWFIAHQANDRINSAVRDALRLPAEKVPSNIARYGNTSGATIFILTDEMLRDGRLKRGDLVCFFALGAGLHWGASLMRL